MAILNEFGNPVTFAHAADRSTRRGPQFAVRNEDIDKLIPSHDRKTLASLSNRLFWNMGVPRACVLQKADYAVGEAWLPSYLGPDQEAGKQVAKFMSEVWLPQCNVRGGNSDWWKLLEMTSIAIDVVGDNFWILVKGDDGFPRIQVVANHRCTSGTYSSNQRIAEDGPFEGYRINDGVIYYASGRAAGYRFDVSPVNTTTQVFKDIPASDVIHNLEQIDCDQGRGFPAFTHALESLKMSLFSTEDERIRQQIVSRLHLTIFNESGGPDPDDPLNSIPNKEARDAGEFASKAFPGGVYYSANGDRIEQMKHENPGPIWDSFQDRIVRDAVISVWSYSVWKGSGQGTDARAEVVKCRRFVTKRQSQLWNSARRAFAWAYSVFAEQGRVPKLQNPMAWDFSRPPRLSVDDGRESKMELDELRTGSRNLEEILEARGLTEDQFLYKRAWSVANRKMIARQVAKEASEKFGEAIEIEDREMFMQTPNETTDAEQTNARSSPNLDEDGNEMDEQGNNERMKFDNLKAKFDAYGVAVRAGAITPSDVDETQFRKEAGLPAMTPAVKGAWKEDRGFRRPITLLQAAAASIGLGPKPQTTQEDE